MTSARRPAEWLAVAGLLSGLLAVTGDVGAQATAPPAPFVGGVRPVEGGVTGLAALPSASPASGFEAGGGGLAGPTWGLFGDVTDAGGVLRAVGVQVDLGTPGWGPGATYAVFDAGTTTQVWPAAGTSTSSIVPAGVLRNGGAYELAVTVGTVTTRRAFTVDGSRAGAVAGVMSTQVSSTPVSVNTGQKMGLALAYSSADVGVTPSTGAIGRLDVGLPPGWSWSGVGADVWRAEVVDGSASLPGVNRIVKVYGSGVLVLGCREQAGLSVCDSADGQLVGEGPRAVVAADRSVVLSEQSVGQGLTFDPSGRIVRVAQPGAPVVVVTYTAVGGLDTVTWEVGSSPVVWDVFYPGDSSCDDSALPSGFVSTPAGHVCGWTDPAGQRTRVLYSQPAGASVPRLSRIVQLPACSAAMTDCDPNLTEFSDFGWDAGNRLSATRDTLTARATLAGLISATDDSHWRRMTYDELGRLQTEHSPSPVTDSRGRLVAQANAVLVQMAYVPAESGLAPATQQVAVTTNGAGSSLTTTTAVDDGGRVMGSRAPANGVTRQVWAPFNDLQLATIYPNDQLEATVFDRWFRRTGKHMGPAAAFGSACTPTAPQRGATDPATGDWTACAPLAGTTRATSQLIGFDEQARVGAGLTAAVFAPAGAGLPSPFSGNPIAHGAADQQTGAAPGIPMAAVAPAATTGSGVRFDGGLVFPAGSGTDPWALVVSAPPDLVTTGLVMVDGRFCAVLDPGEGSCDVTPDTRAQHITVDVELARAPLVTDRLVLSVQDDEGDTPVIDNTFLTRRWSADTTLTKSDPLPAGTITGWVPTTRTEHTYGCGPASAPEAERVACIGSATTAVHDPGGQAITRRYTYGADAYGGVRLVAATTPEGSGSTTYEFWGVNDTAASLPNAAQLGELVTVAQRALPKTVTLPGGRATTTVHDAYGTPVCQQVNGGPWTCTTLDVTRRPITHTVRANEPGVPPVTITTDYAPAANPLINRTSRSSGGTTLTDQTVLDPSGRVLTYTDSLTATTVYTYDGMGRLATSTITPPVTPGKRSRPRAISPTGLTYTNQYDPTTGLPTGITFQGQPLVAMAYDTPQRPWLPTRYTYTLTGGTMSVAVNYDSDLNPFGRTWTFADGTTLLDCATTAVAPTACTPAVGDTQPGTTASGRLLARTVDGRAHRFTYDTARRLTAAQVGATGYGYTWDDNNNLTGRMISGTTTESYTYTFNAANQLTATTDPQATIGGFDADANHTGIGADSYTYDALHQLASVTNTTNGQTIAYSRDARGRIATHTAAGQTYHLGYSLPNDQQPTLTIDATGTATPLLALPGGLLFRGASQGPVVNDMQGNSILTLTVDGRRPATPIQQYEPFGQPTPDTVITDGNAAADFAWQQNQTDGPLSHVGVRALHTRLGTFLQPDPQPHGSHAGPYSYTNADPINQADPTGMCVGWACVKDISPILQPMADIATLFACVMGFGIGCFVTSVLRLAISVLNVVADVELHQDAAYDGVTVALSLLNVVAATPLLYETIQLGRAAEFFGVERSALEETLVMKPAEHMLAAVELSGASWGEDTATRWVRFARYLDDLSLWNTRATNLARAISLLSVAGEAAADITSARFGTVNCCWKLW